MKYNSRTEVETIGRTGTYSYKEDDVIVARQMSSFWLYVNPLDKGFTPHAVSDGFWEAWVTLWMSQNVKPNSVCVDVGANCGFYTFFLAQHGCKVFSFEPDPKCATLLNRSNRINGCEDRVVIENLAVTDGKNAEITLWEFSGHSMNTTIDGNAETCDSSFVAKTTSLDAYFPKTKNAGKIDFVKIDAEGSEQLIWQGMQRMLTSNPNCMALMEFVAWHYEKNGKPFLTDMMKTHCVTYVDYAGDEQPIESNNFFETDSEDLRMLVLRKKQ